MRVYVYVYAYMYTTLEELPEEYLKFKNSLKPDDDDGDHMEYFFCRNKNGDDTLINVGKYYVHIYIYIDNLQTIFSCGIKYLENTDYLDGGDSPKRIYSSGDISEQEKIEKIEQEEKDIHSFGIRCGEWYHNFDLHADNGEYIIYFDGNVNKFLNLDLNFFEYISCLFNLLDTPSFDANTSIYKIKKTEFVHRLNCFDSLQFDNDEEKQIIEKINSFCNSEILRKVLIPRRDFYF